MRTMGAELPPAVAAAFGDPPTLRTARLVLRRFRPEDAEDIFAYASDPQMTTWVPWEAHRSLDDSRAFVERVLQKYRERREAEWVITLRPGGRVIGTVRLGQYHPVHRRADLGYAVGRAWWGQGYATEAARAVVAFGFSRLDLNRIWAICDPGNGASERVMQKVGMRFEGVLREHMYEKGEFRDVKLYAILRRDWEPGAGSPAPTGA